MKETRIPDDTPAIVVQVESGTLEKADLSEFMQALVALEPGRPVLFGVIPRGGGGPEWEEFQRQAITSITHIVEVWLPLAWEHGADTATKALGIVKIIESFAAWARKRHPTEKVSVTSQARILGPTGRVISVVEVSQEGLLREITDEHSKDSENDRPPMNILEE